MARYENGINGRFHGKVGPTVGCTWKGIDYIRSRPRRSRKKPSEAQLINRKIFTFLEQWLNPIGAMVGVGFNDYSPRMTGRMAAHSYNYHHALKGEYPDMEIDYASALFSYGPLAGVSDLKSELTDEKTLTVSWNPKTQDKNARSSDLLMLVVYVPDHNQALCCIGTAGRNDGHYDFEIHEEFGDQRLEVMVGFKSLLKSTVSTSQYAGRIN